MIDASFVEAIAKMQRAAEPPLIVKSDALPKNVHFKRNPDGTYTRCAERIMRKCHVYDLRSLVAWAVQKSELEGVVLYVNEHGVQAFEDLSNADSDQAIMPVRYSPAMQLLHQMAESKDGEFMSQKDVIKLLNTRLRGYANEGTVSNFRKLKFTSNTSAEAELRANKANIGKTLEQEVTGAVPEAFFLTVPVFDNPSLGIGSHKVNVVVDVDFTTQQFCLYVSKDELLGITQAAIKCLQINVEAALEGHDKSQGHPIRVLSGMAIS